MSDFEIGIWITGFMTGIGVSAVLCISFALVIDWLT